MTAVIGNYLKTIIQNFFIALFEVFYGLVLCAPGYLVLKLTSGKKPDINSKRVWLTGALFWIVAAVLIWSLTHLL